MNVYLKKLSGEVIPLSLSPDDLLYPAVRSLGVEPGYTFRLFTSEEEELPGDATPQDGETLLVVYQPVRKIHGHIVCLHTALIRTPESDAYDYYNKFMMEIAGSDGGNVVFTHRMNFYTQSWADIGMLNERVFIPEDSVRVLAAGTIGNDEDGNDEDDEKVERIGEKHLRIEHLTETFVPREYPEDLRFRMKTKLNKIWNGTMFLY